LSWYRYGLLCSGYAALPRFLWRSRSRSDKPNRSPSAARNPAMPCRRCAALSLLLLLLPLSALAAPGDKPIPPTDAPKAMTLPPRFSVALFAGEPDVVQPIAFAIDDRGRLWVVECLSYPQWNEKGEGHDRVLIFEDTDGDGVFDKRTVFYDQGVNLSG